MISASRIRRRRRRSRTSFADWTAERLRAAIAARGAALLMVSGGKTPERFFAALSDEELDWTRVAVTLADERRVPDHSPRSNARLVREKLLRNRATAAAFTPLADAASRTRNSRPQAPASPACPCPPTSSSSAWATTAIPPRGFPAPRGCGKRWTPARANWSRRSCARRARAAADADRPGHPARQGDRAADRGRGKLATFARRSRPGRPKPCRSAPCCRRAATG